MKELDHKKIALLAAKRAIDETTISSGISKKDRTLIFEELNNISEGLSDMDINNPDSWLPLSLYDIGTQFNK